MSLKLLLCHLQIIKGPITFEQSTIDNKTIILENTSRMKDIELTNWIIKRKVDSNQEIVYKFPDRFVLRANKKVKIWARGQGKDNFNTDLVNTDIDSWGTGAHIVTILMNELGEEKATHTQKTTSQQ